MILLKLNAIWLFITLLMAGFVLFLERLICKPFTPNHEIILQPDDSPPKYYVTGDKHRHFENIERFTKMLPTRKKDVLIILGDAGINYYEDARDEELKRTLTTLEITLFCIHGNKEKRPQLIDTYQTRKFCGGFVYFEPQYPNILFAVDGEIYTFNGNKYLVIGGAHSIDKLRCIQEGLPYWENEMPDSKTKERIEQILSFKNDSVYGILTHTCPLKYLPTETFRSNQTDSVKHPYEPDIDRSVEEWFDKIEEQVPYHIWYCGHYHLDKAVDRLHIIHHNIIPL